MKKILILFSFYAFLTACGGNSGNTENSDTAAASDMAAATKQTEADTNVNDIGTNRAEGSAPSGAYAKGAQLISQSDCLTCHKEDTKIIGPSYQEVAEKYQANDANIKDLASKIIKGGSGVWGDIPMTPHPAVSEDDAGEMVKYILSLKK